MFYFNPSITSTANVLRRSLSGAFHVVPRPDHPLLLSGPDLIVGGEGKLTAIFFINRRTSLQQLTARITATRLAMPSNTRLFAQVSSDAQVDRNVQRNFDEICPEGRVNILLQYCISDAPQNINQQALVENKRKHSERYSFALLLTSLRRKHELNKVPPQTVINELASSGEGLSTLSAKATKKLAQCTLYNGSYVTSLNMSRNPVIQLRDLCHSALTENYLLDTGVPYEKSGANLNVVLVEQWPVVRHDPEKPIRSAAFGLWIMAESSSADDISLLIDRARDPKFVRTRHA